jgi:hypothetical protein
MPPQQCARIAIANDCINESEIQQDCINHDRERHSIPLRNSNKNNQSLVHGKEFSHFLGNWRIYGVYSPCIYEIFFKNEDITRVASPVITITLF